MTLEPTRVLRRKPDVVARQVAGEDILVPVRGRLADLQRIFALNPVGEFIWNRLDGRMNLASIAQEVRAEFDVSDDEAEGDVREFVSRLLDEGLVEEAS
jgi:hypothetical protein